MSGIVVGLEGEKGVHDMLMSWADPKRLEERNRRGARAAAMALRGPLKGAAGGVSGRMRQSVYIHQRRGDRNAMYVGHHKRKAYFWHMVIGGTQEHGPRKAPFLNYIPGWNEYMGTSQPPKGWRATLRVAGTKPRPIVDQVVATYGSRALDLMMNEIEKGA